MRRPSPPPPPPPSSTLPSKNSWNLLAFSEETRERIIRLTEYAKRTVYYGWIPLILLLGMELFCQSVLYNVGEF